MEILKNDFDSYFWECVNAINKWYHEKKIMDVASYYPLHDSWNNSVNKSIKENIFNLIDTLIFNENIEEIYDRCKTLLKLYDYVIIK